MTEKKNKRFIFLIIGIVFFVFTAICTVYSIQIYPDSLVKVDVIMPESKVIRGDITGFEVPKTAIIPDPTDINMIRYLEVEQREAAWGYKYFVREKLGFSNIAGEEILGSTQENVIIMPLGEESGFPVITTYTGEYYEGLEVTFG